MAVVVGTIVASNPWSRSRSCRQGVRQVWGMDHRWLGRMTARGSQREAGEDTMHLVHTMARAHMDILAGAVVGTGRIHRRVVPRRRPRRP